MELDLEKSPANDTRNVDDEAPTPTAIAAVATKSVVGLSNRIPSVVPAEPPKTNEVRRDSQGQADELLHSRYRLLPKVRLEALLPHPHRKQT